MLKDSPIDKFSGHSELLQEYDIATMAIIVRILIFFIIIRFIFCIKYTKNIFKLIIAILNNLYF